MSKKPKDCGRIELTGVRSSNGEVLLRKWGALDIESIDSIIATLRRIKKHRYPLPMLDM